MEIIMKTILVLVVIGAAIVDASNVTDPTQEATTEYEPTPTNSSEEKRWMRPIFPKSVQQIVLTTEPPFPNTTTTSVNRLSKRPVFKVIPKTLKMKGENYWKTSTTRRALMKYTKFTVDPATTFKIILDKADKDQIGGVKRKYKIDPSHKTSNAANKDDSSEEILETSKPNDKRKDKTQHVKTLARRFHNLHSKISKGKYIEKISKSKDKIKKILTHNKVTHGKSEAELSSEEKEDRKEFIFVTPKQIKEQTARVTEDSDESDETTTIILEKDLKLKQRRSINVIEEENLGTTVSGFKFTGKVNSLNSDLVFRNINT